MSSRPGQAASRRRFRSYWLLVSPGVRLIRRQMLRLARRDLRRQARA